MVIIFLRVLKIVSWWIESSLLVHLKAYKQPTDAAGWFFFFGSEGLELVRTHPIFGVLNRLSRSWRQCCGLRLPYIVCTKCCCHWSDYFFINYSLLLLIEPLSEGLTEMMWHCFEWWPKKVFGKFNLKSKQGKQHNCWPHILIILMQCQRQVTH